MRLSFTIHSDLRGDVLGDFACPIEKRQGTAAVQDADARDGGPSECDRFRSARAFTLIECIFAVMLISGCAVALYSAITWGFLNIRFAREELKATQIMLEKMEVVRLCTWDQILSNNFIPQTFSVPYSGSLTDKTAGAPIYSGTIGIDKPVLGLNYENGMRLVTISLTWSNRDIVHRRGFSTYISQYGVNKYH